MSIPLATTTITVLAPVDGDDSVSPGVGAPVLTRVPAVFARPTGTDVGASRVDARLLCDPIALTQRNVVVDETTFTRWSVVWVDARQGLGMDHTVAGVNRIRGAA